MGAADRLRRGLAQAEVPNLAGLDQLRHRADRLLDLDVRVDAVLVVEVDLVDAEALQGAVDRLPDVLRGAVEPAERRHVAGDGVVQVALELARDHVLIALALDRLADQLLVGQRAVDLRGVEEVDAKLEGALDGRLRLLQVGLAVEGGHTHAAKSDLRDLEVTKISSLHFLPSLSR